VTADLYATASGLIGRSAAVFVSGVPEDAADDGLFGPASLTWRVSTDLASQPGVLEARQRITLRMRAGRPA
jgi:hypothetical protein